MAQTLTEKIFSHALGRDVRAGEIVVVRPNVVMSHDSLTPSIIDILQDDFGRDTVYDPGQLVFSFDHVAPASTVGTAESMNKVRVFARRNKIRLFDVGRGICHQVLVEEGGRMGRPFVNKYPTSRDGLEFASFQIPCQGHSEIGDAFPSYIRII